MSKKYRIALIGAGDRGNTYSKAFTKVGNAEFVNVCDIQEDRINKFKQDYGYENGYSDYKDAILKNNIDIVVVCTPAYLHPEISILAMDNGKHVICEKPMALSLKRAQDMIQAAEKNNVQLAIGLQYLNMRPNRKIKQAIDEGIIGRPIMMNFADIRQVRPKTAMHDAEFGNGGPMVDMSCHFFDLMRWFYGSDPVRVTAKDFTYASKGYPQLDYIENKAPDTAAIIVEFESSDIGVISICWGLPEKVNGESQCYAFGPLGLLQATGKDAVTCKVEGGIIKEIILAPEIEEQIKAPEQTLIIEFAKAIENNVKPQRTGNDGLIGLAVSLAALRSAAQGRTVELKEIYNEMPDVLSCLK